MAQRALILGSQIEGLRGVDNDCRRMATVLAARGFAIDLRIGAAATRAGILAGYDQLITACSDEDAAVVYYCGHGYHASVAQEARAWQCIAPTDLRAGTDTDWRGITAWELSIKQTQLTTRTRNVTVLLDCCHSAQLSRSAGNEGTPRALPHPVNLGFDRHLAALRARYGSAFDAVDPLGNPHAVRVVACGQTEAAFEYADDTGTYHGAFTDALADVLLRAGDAPVSWAAAISAIRARVLRSHPRQRPRVEGPIRRGIFSLVEHEDQRCVAITVVDEAIRLSAGELTGAAVGDVYAVLPASAPFDSTRALAHIEITDVAATSARARRTSDDRHAIPCAPIPLDVIAVPVRRSATRWPITIDAPDAARITLEAALAASPTLRSSRPGESSTLATVLVANDTVAIEDASGLLFPPASFPARLDGVLTHLSNLAVAQGIRDLEGERGVLAGELAIELGTVCDGQPRRLPEHGGVLTVMDRYYLNIERRGRRTLFVHALNLSARGKITLLTHYERGGVVLDSRRPSVMIGQRADGAIGGVGLRWPAGMPSDGTPRLTEFVVIATPTTSDLSGLETREIEAMRSGGNLLECTLAQLCDGVYRAACSTGDPDGFLVKRLSILLDPGDPSGRGRANESTPY